jgi:hypothetical protein
VNDHQTRDLDRLEVQSRSWCPGELVNAHTVRQKGNNICAGFAGYRQRGRGEARIAKRHRARVDRRIGKMQCENLDG